MRRVLVLMALISAIISLPAAATCAARMWEYYYYYDSAKTQYAGFCLRDCYAQWNCDGVKTSYYTARMTDYCQCDGMYSSASTMQGASSTLSSGISVCSSALWLGAGAEVVTGPLALLE